MDTSHSQRKADAWWTLPHLRLCLLGITRAFAPSQRLHKRLLPNSISKTATVFLPPSPIAKTLLVWMCAYDARTYLPITQHGLSDSRAVDGHDRLHPNAVVPESVDCAVAAVQVFEQHVRVLEPVLQDRQIIAEERERERTVRPRTTPSIDAIDCITASSKSSKRNKHTTRSTSPSDTLLTVEPNRSE